jgi:hypothetical protein
MAKTGGKPLLTSADTLNLHRLPTVDSRTWKLFGTVQLGLEERVDESRLAESGFACPSERGEGQRMVTGQERRGREPRTDYHGDKLEAASDWNARY